MFRRKRLAMLVAEFLGTGVLTLAVLTVQRSQLGLAYFVALAAGLSVALLTYVFGGVSGAQMNPALTFGRVKTVPALTYIIVQLLGAWAAYGLYHFFVHTDVQAVNQDFNTRILIAEAIGAMVFTLGWAAAAYNRFEEGRFAAVAGLAFAVGVIVASAASVGLANPALAVGVRAWEVFGENGWLNYFVGPMVGGVMGINLYGLLFADSDRPFSVGLRRRSAAANAAGSSTSAVADEDVDEDDKPARKTKTVAATPAGATKVAKAKKTTTKKVPARKKTTS
jgi:glycerol uptake facilitator-like aquaporin